MHRNDDLRNSLIVSTSLHVGAMVVLYFGIPAFYSPPEAPPWRPAVHEDEEPRVRTTFGRSFFLYFFNSYQISKSLKQRTLGYVIFNVVLIAQNDIRTAVLGQIQISY